MHTPYRRFPISSRGLAKLSDSCRVMSMPQTKYLPVRPKLARAVREGDTIVHLDGEPALVTFAGYSKDEHGPVYSFAFEGDRVPYACREGEQINMLKPVPEVGDGATLCLPSDRYPYEITAVSDSGKTLKIRRLTHDLKQIPEAGEDIARWSRKFGRYQRGGLPVSVGGARHYQAPEV